MDLTKEVLWSQEAYDLGEIRHRSGPCPLLLLKAGGDVHGTTTGENVVPQEQLVLVHKWEESERMMIKNKRGIKITIPTDHIQDFEVYKPGLSLRSVGVYSLENIMQNFNPPVLGKFNPNKTTSFYVRDKLLESKSFGFLEFLGVHYLYFAKSSGIDARGRINREVINMIPTNAGVKYFVGKSMHKYSTEYYSEFLQEVSRASGPLVHDPTQVFSFSGIMEYTDNMVVERLDGSDSWGRKKIGDTLPQSSEWESPSTGERHSISDTSKHQRSLPKESKQPGVNTANIPQANPDRTSKESLSYENNVIAKPYDKEHKESLKTNNKSNYTHVLPSPVGSTPVLYDNFGVQGANSKREESTFPNRSPSYHSVRNEEDGIMGEEYRQSFNSEEDEQDYVNVENDNSDYYNNPLFEETSEKGCQVTDDVLENPSTDADTTSDKDSGYDCQTVSYVDSNDESECEYKNVPFAASQRPYSPKPALPPRDPVSPKPVRKHKVQHQPTVKKPEEPPPVPPRDPVYKNYD